MCICMCEYVRSCGSVCVSVFVWLRMCMCVRICRRSWENERSNVRVKGFLS